jgi:arylsulfatase A
MKHLNLSHRAVALMAVVLIALAFAAPSRAADRPPNIVLVLADDLGVQELSCYGNKQNKTPNLDKLAAEGMRFTTCWATPLCSPTRVELITGRYGFRTGWCGLFGRIYAPKPGDPNYDLGTAQITFADILKTRGYATGLSGKWQLSGTVPTLIHDCGFDEYIMWAYTYNLPPGVKHTGAFQNGGKTTSRYWNPCIMENGQYKPTKPNDYGPDIFNDWVIDFAKRHKDEPFIIYNTQPLTHPPHVQTPDPDHPGQRKPGTWKNNVEYLDYLMGKLVKSIDDAGLRDNTYIFFVGDNGTSGDGKGHTVEKGVHVPFIARGPGIKPGSVTDALVDCSDFTPTMAELAGAKLPTDRTYDGVSFVPVLRGEKPSAREWIFSYLHEGRLIRDNRFFLDGAGKLYDCGTSRDGTGYKDVTDSKDPEVVAARERFAKIYETHPAPPHEDKPATQTKGEE